MIAFRALLALIAVTVLVYTGFVGAVQGWNLDFSGLLVLSGLWLAWRHRFSIAGIALGLLAVVGGSPVLCTYLFIVSVQARGDAKVVMLGKARAEA
jgi:hypothetical protein